MITKSIQEAESKNRELVQNLFSEAYYSNKGQIDDLITKSIQEAESKNRELVQNLFSIKDIQVDNQRNATSS